MPEILIYTTAACLSCQAATALLRRASLSYREIDLATDERGRDVLARHTGRRTFPQVIVDGRRVGGYGELARRLDGGALGSSGPAAA